jgi:exosortase F-associated protein
MKSQRQEFLLRFFWIAAILCCLTVIYVFQRLDYLHVIQETFGLRGDPGPNITFIFNRSLRLVLNDLLCFLLILILLREQKYLRIAFILFCFEFFLMLPIYFFVKLTIEGDSEISSPLLSQIHRLIINPMLMIVLIMAFYYQRFWTNSK